jgi:hypothetical protein
LVHFVLAAGGWVLFGLFWVRVFHRTPPADSAVGVLVVGILLVVSVSLTVAWIRHNLLLHRRFRHRRLRVPEVRADWSRDKLGRPVSGPGWETLQSAAEVEVGLDGGGERKTYRVLSG